MKRFVMAIALACVLSGSASAGDVYSVGAPAPVAPPAQSSVAATVVLAILSLIR